MKMKMEIGNGVSLIGTQEDVTAISVLVMNGDLSIEVLPQANPAPEPDPENEWYKYVTYHSSTKGAVLIGDMNLDHLGNAIMSKIKKNDIRRGLELVDMVDNNTEFQALLLELCNRLS